MENSSRNQDDLSDLERRLSGWRPGVEGLNTDAMLYAAGIAAGRREHGRLLWPTLSVLLVVTAVGAGVWGLAERAERRALASILRQRVPERVADPATVSPDRPEPSYTPAPDDYFSLRRQLERDPNLLLASMRTDGPETPGPPPPERSILKAGQREALFNQ